MGGSKLGVRSTFKLGVGKQSSVFPTRRFSVDFKVNWFVDFIANRQRLGLKRFSSSTLRGSVVKVDRKSRSLVVQAKSRLLNQIVGTNTTVFLFIDPS